MPSNPLIKPSDVVWVQGGQNVTTIDLSLPAQSLPRYIGRYRGYNFSCEWGGTPYGQVVLQVANAETDRNEQPIQGINPIIWWPVPGTALVLGASTGPTDTTPYSSSPDALGEDALTHPWAQILWVPTTSGGNTSAGTMFASFSGVGVNR